MNSDNKQIRDVADVAARIMAGLPPIEEELKGGQKKIDKNHNGKIDGQDFAILRGEKKANEEVEQIDELSKDTLNSYVKKSFSDKEKDKLNTPERQKGLRKATSRLYKEEEQIDEVKMADLPSTKVQGRAYGASKPEPHAVDVMKGPKEKELKDIEAEKKKKKFSEMVDTYKNEGIKSFLESIKKEEEIIDEISKETAEYTMDVIDAGQYSEVTIGEEASEDEFNAEIKKAQAKSQGKDKAEVAKGSVQAVKQEETEITDEMIFEMLEESGIDFESLSDEELQQVTDEAYEILKERHMTEPEMKKREKIVKSMKKGLSGFKERYGDRAKNVMYATATKQAMKD